MCRYRRPERRSTHRISDRGGHVNTGRIANSSDNHGCRFGNGHPGARPDRGSCDCDEHANPNSACRCHSHSRHHSHDTADSRACGNRNNWSCGNRNARTNTNHNTRADRNIFACANANTYCVAHAAAHVNPRTDAPAPIGRSHHPATWHVRSLLRKAA